MLRLEQRTFEAVIARAIVIPSVAMLKHTSVGQIEETDRSEGDSADHKFLDAACWRVQKPIVLESWPKMATIHFGVKIQSIEKHYQTYQKTNGLVHEGTKMGFPWSFVVGSISMNKGPLVV